MNSLYYKPCFGEMKYNFSSNIFKTSVNKDTLKVYVPLTRLIPINISADWGSWALIILDQYPKLLISNDLTDLKSTP